MGRLAVGALALAGWIYLPCFRGGFWRTEEGLGSGVDGLERRERWPEVAALIPARNEAHILPETLPSVLDQEYPGTLKVYLVSDRSEDGTARQARGIYGNVDTSHAMEVIHGEPLPEGWTGKVWAMQQGYREIREDFNPDYLWLTDADIHHPPDSLQTLVGKAKREDLSMVSLMALLETGSFWDRIMLPSFVFFFRKLYPFGWVNDPEKSTAAAAGGCVLVDFDLMENINGFRSISDSLIDDCSLAQLINQKSPSSSIWLGLMETVKSLRRYESLSEIWKMVARNAAEQLDYSLTALFLVIVGMVILYLVPPVFFAWGIAVILTEGVSLLGLTAAAVPFCAWTLMLLCFVPISRFYDLSPAYGLSLPLVAFLYVAMSVDSMFRFRENIPSSSDLQS